MPAIAAGAEKEMLLLRQFAVGLALLGVLALGGCASGSAVVETPNAAQYFPTYDGRGTTLGYRISPQDKININVFQVEDLTLEEVQVDASGKILLPLIGSVQAAGLTTTELSEEIASRLSERYMHSPQVSVLVAESVAQKVTVSGSVTESGVYELKGETTLLQAIAMAKGPSRVAALNDVAVFRRINGERMVAVFDLAAIRSGTADDPMIIGNDVVVVGLSNVKGVWREVVSALPGLAVFAPIYR